MVLDFFAAIYIGSPPPALSFRCLFFSRLHACLQSTSGIQNARFSFFPLFDTAKVVLMPSTPCRNACYALC